MEVSETIKATKEALEPLTKVVENVYKHWFTEFIMFSSMALIIFASQLTLIPIDRYSDKINVFIILMVLGFSMYWYLISGFLSMLFVTFLSLHDNSFSKFMAHINLFGVFLGGILVVFPTGLMYLVGIFFSYQSWFHYIVFILSHFILIVLTRRLFMAIAKAPASKKPNS